MANRLSLDPVLPPPLPCPAGSAFPQLTQLKYENERLKIALGTSSTNAKRWEQELQTLKNNNVSGLKLDFDYFTHISRHHTAPHMPCDVFFFVSIFVAY